ncbi:unnamed protein product [Aureobasidium uvarum]|uniref:Uncharacterized protein n=1 Tax=Aureobasidium uvarum TaxID=2773716 RepID=A0A9N8PXX0_9PEZI|nr:unnamed protein product [Aureobasidium uvarum]
MPGIIDPPAPLGPITREMLIQLMTLARDTSFPDAQIRAICDTVTQENVSDSIELLRRLHASQETSLVLTSAASPVQSISSFESRPQARPVKRTSSEPGAVLCADTFYRLCKDDRIKLQRLSAFCPFTLVFRKCPHGGGCQLEHICWVCSTACSCHRHRLTFIQDAQCKRPASCRFSHKVAPTCDSVFDGTRCSRTRRLVNDNKKRACPRNHDYKVRLFMGAMRVSHELGFYGVDRDKIDPNVAFVKKIGDVVESDWMASDVEEIHSEHEGNVPAAGVEESETHDCGDKENTENVAGGDAVPNTDLMWFS